MRLICFWKNYEGTFFFLEVGLYLRDEKFTRQADELRIALKNFWQIVLHWLTGVISKTSIKSGEFVTQYTLEAEKLTEFYTGIPFKTKITQAEKNLMAGSDFHPLMERKVFALNRRASIFTG